LFLVQQERPHQKWWGFLFLEKFPRREHPSEILVGGITHEYYRITHLPHQRQPSFLPCTSPSKKIKKKFV
jgi:hypothetical protein